MQSYATLQEIVGAINTQKVDAAQYAQLLRNADYASRRADLLLASELPFFMPFQEVWDVPVEASAINSERNTLDLGRFLLEFGSVSINGTDTFSDAAAYPARAAPIRTLRLTTRTKSWYGWGANCVNTPPSITVGNIWGFRRRGATRWKTVGKLHVGIDDAVTDVAIDDTGGTALEGENDTLSAGMLLRIGTEYLVKDYSASSNTLERGANGTAPAAHNPSDPVDVWQVEEPIRDVVARQAGLLLARRGAYETRGSNELTPIVYPSDLRVELLAALDYYARL